MEGTPRHGGRFTRYFRTRGELSEPSGAIRIDGPPACSGGRFANSRNPLKEGHMFTRQTHLPAWGSETLSEKGSSATITRQV